MKFSSIDAESAILCCDPKGSLFLKRLLRSLRKKGETLPPVISASFEVTWELEAKGIMVEEHLDRILPRGRFPFLHREAERLARHWYGEFSVGSFLEWEVAFYLYRLLRQFEALRMLCQRRGFSRWIIIEPETPSFARLEEIRETYHALSAFQLLQKETPGIEAIYLKGSLPVGEKAKKNFSSVLKGIRSRLAFLNYGRIFSQSPLEKWKDPARRTVVFFPFYTASQNSSVLSRLSEDSSVRIMILTLGEGKGEGPAGTQLVGLKNYGEREFLNEKKQTETFFKEKWRSFTEEGEERFRFGEISLWPAVRKDWKWLFEKRFPQMMEHAIRFQTLLRQEKVSLFVVAVDTHDPEKHLVCLANEEGIETLLIQHGMISSPFSFFPVSVRHVAVWGEVWKEKLASGGVPPEQITVTGCPRFDRYAGVRHPGPVGRANERIALIVDPFITGNVIFEDEAFSDREVISFLKPFLSAIRFFPDKELWVKIRPECPNHPELVRRLLREAGLSHAKVVRDKDPIELFEHCKVLITTNSAMGIEASLLGIPILTSNFPNVPLNDYYVEQGIALKVQTPEETVFCLERILRDETLRKELAVARERFIFNHTFLKDGEASKRVFFLIQELLNNSPPRPFSQTEKMEIEACSP